MTDTERHLKEYEKYVEHGNAPDTKWLNPNEFFKFFTEFDEKADGHWGLRFEAVYGKIVVYTRILKTDLHDYVGERKSS